MRASETPLLAGKLQECRVVAALLPVAQLDGASVLYVVVAVDGDALRFHPLVVELRPADVGTAAVPVRARFAIGSSS